MFLAYLYRLNGCKSRDWAGLFAAFVLLIIPGMVNERPARAAPPVSTAPAKLDLAEVLANVRKAIGYEQLKKHEGGILIDEVSDMYGHASKCSLLFTPKKYVCRVSGIDWTFGFDGTDFWAVDWSGTPYVQELGHHQCESWQLSTWIRIGLWLDKQNEIETTLPVGCTTSDHVAVSTRLKGGMVEYWVVIDRSTWLPKAVYEAGHLDAPVLRFGDYRRVMGFCFPHRTILTSDGSDSTSKVRSITTAPRGKRNPYTLSANMMDDTRFNTDHSPDVVLKRSQKTGHLLVRSRIDGQDAGWFILDSGTGFAMIDPKIAERLNMPIVFEDYATLNRRGKSSPTSLNMAREVQIGPLRISKLVYFQVPFMDLLSTSIGDEVSGIYGYDIFRRSVIELDISKATLKIHDPDTYSGEEVNWREFFYDNRLIYVRCGFEGSREALFLIDTGSDSTVSFNAAAWEHFKLLDGRETTRTLHKDLMESLWSSRPGDKGTIEWFEIGGHRIDNVTASFAPPQPDGEPYGDQSPAGAIGLGLLDKFKVIFDYPHKRIAFIKQPEAENKEESPHPEP